MNKLTLLLSAVVLSACAVNHQTADYQSTTLTHDNLPTTAVIANQPLIASDIKQPQNRHATASEIAECQKQGGSISKQGLAQFDFCVVEFADKGKTCDDGSQCQSGRCLVDGSALDHSKPNAGITTKITGSCAKNNVPFGCYGMIHHGEFGGFLCVD